MAANNVNRCVRFGDGTPPLCRASNLPQGQLCQQCDNEHRFARDVTRIKPRSAANARNQHLNIPNINTPGKTTIKQLIHNIYSVNSVSLLSKARPANKHDCSKSKQSLFVSPYHLASIGLEVLNYMTTRSDTDSASCTSHMSCRTCR